ncbi:glycosyltransferase family 4 protein [Aliivibrio fischeri]|uniref:glycosyltransferase family 4 protein n=1 Tax=Aliivibrio fischeri TaxID=668 RepID=UPI0007C58962|nr:glycosyltransferase [Aliivibrio fischeri]MBP3139738.1 glycosyltransferase [Aliivibrio fischeri]MBP3154123.1 glycosyltransferase [Aliivibrio fischeri]MCE7574865.1 glycosyltransferase [Aliivibrio fischeri]
MKTIIHVVQHLSPGGLESMVLDMLEFTSQEHRIVIVSLDGTYEETIENWPRLQRYQEQIICLNKSAGFSFKAINQLLNLFKEYNADVVHSHHIGPLIYSGIAAKLNKKINHVHTEHDAWHLNASKHRRLQRFALSLSQPKLVADASFVKKALNNIFNSYPIYTIKNGINPYKFSIGDKQKARNKLNIILPVNSIVVGNAGRLETVKGQLNLIEAFRFLNSKYHLLLAGSGSQKEHLMQLVKRYHLEDRVHFLGHIDHMPTFYHALDLFCLPSNNEGFPLSTLEAQACGIPCIANDVGGVSETLCPKSSILVSNNAAITLAQAIESMTHKTRKFSSRDFILKNNHAQSMVNAYEELYFEGANL